MHEITILVFVSRKNYLQQVMSSIELMECKPEKTNILAIVDGDSELFTEVRNVIEFMKFNQRLTIQYKSDTVKSNYDVIARRKRISELHNFAKQYINGCHFIFGVEDDTVIPMNALTRMYSHYLDKPHMGFIQGIELGRWGVPYLGAWLTDDIYNTKEIYTTRLYDGLEEVDAGGFYCFMTRTEIYMNHEFKPFENNDLGPDVDFGIELRRQGLINYTDYSLRCIHLNEDKQLRVDNTDIEVIKVIKENNRWRLKREINKTIQL